MTRPKNPTDVHVGRRIRMRRLLIGMSQTELANRIDLTFQQVQKYEKGINRIGASRVFEIALALGVVPSYFFTGLNGEPASEIEMQASEQDLASIENLQAMATRQGVELNRAFLKVIDPAIRQLVLDLLESIAREYDVPGSGVDNRPSPE